MASNVADIWLFYSTAEAATYGALGDLSNAVAAVVGIKAIPSRCQVKQFGFIVTASYAGQTTDPVYALRRLPAGGAAATLVSSALGPSNANLVRYTTSPDVIGAGGPGTVNIGPMIGGNTTVITVAAMVAGVVLLADNLSLPTLVLEAGDGLSVERTTAAIGGTGRVLPFVRLEVAGEQYTLSNTFWDNA